MANGFFAEVAQSTVTLVTSYSPVFLTTGLSMFRSIAVVRLLWEGFRIAFRAAPANVLAELMVTIAITYSCLVYYSSPMPGVGKGLTSVITDAGTDLAATIDTASQEAIGSKLADAMGATGGSSWSVIANSTAMVRYFILESILAVMQAAILGVIALGYIVAGILVLIGPIFIPFALVPHFEQFAFGWFRCLIQYAFYPVVGNAYVFVLGHVWMNFFGTLTFPMDSQTLAASLTLIVTIGLAGIYGIFKIPAIVSNLFSGSSGLGGWR